MLGGADPALVGVTPTDVTFRYNTLTRPVSWRDPIVPTPSNVRPSVASAGSLPAGTYGYRIVARRRAGTGIVHSLPSPEVRVTAGAGASVSLQWSAVPDATEYLVYGRAAGVPNQYWTVSSPSFTDAGASGTAGTPPSSASVWQVKNLFELKHARRVLVAYNVMTNNWAQAQSGVAIVITPRNQDGGCPWCVVEDVTFEYNLIRHAGRGITILGYDDTNQSQQTNKIIVRHNEFSDMGGAWGGQGYMVTLLGGARDVTFDHNTMISADLSLVTVDRAPVQNFRFTNNVARHNAYGIKGDGQSVGTPTISAVFPGAVIDRNVLAGGSASYYPAGNLFPSIATFQAHFANYSGLDYSLVPGTDWEAAGTDGLDLGANRPADDSSNEDPQVVTASLPAATEDQTYATTLQAQGGLTPYVWSLANSTLPAGLTLDSFTGAIAGTPSLSGDFAFTVQVQDGGGATAFRPLSIHVEPAIAPVAISTGSLPDGVATVPYTQALQASGGLGTYVWAHVGGTLPMGIALSANGILSGTPAAAGTNTFTVRAADAADATRQATRTLTLLVVPAPNKPPQVVLSPISSPVRAGATVALAATASDPDGIVERVDFYAGTTLLGSSSGPSFTLPWLVPAPGDYRVKAVAVDDRNAATPSAAIDVTVLAAGPALAVSTAAVAPGASITVTLVDGTGAAGDWLAFAPAAAVDSGYLKYTYVGAGVTTRTWTVSAPATPGAYEFRLYANNGYTRIATSGRVTVAGAITSLSPASAPAGSPAFTLTVHGSGFDAGTIVRWNGADRTTTFVSAAQLQAAIPAADVAKAGTAHVTVFSPANGLSAAVPFTIAAAPVLQASSTSVTVGSTITVTLTGGSGSATDWLAIAATGAANTSYLQYTYVGAGVTTRTWTVTIPSTGTYEFRLFRDGYTRMATSAPVSVTEPAPPALTVSTTTAAPGTPVTVTLANGRGGDADWLAFAPAGAANTSYLQWVYVGAGVKTRTWTVTMPSTVGTYEFRLFLNNGYTRAATSPSIKTLVTLLNGTTP
jgi:hypothetical protein